MRLWLAAAGSWVLQLPFLPFPMWYLLSILLSISLSSGIVSLSRRNLPINEKSAVSHSETRWGCGAHGPVHMLPALRWWQRWLPHAFWEQMRLLWLLLPLQDSGDRDPEALSLLIIISTSNAASKTPATWCKAAGSLVTYNNTQSFLVLKIRPNFYW